MPAASWHSFFIRRQNFCNVIFICARMGMVGVTGIANLMVVGKWYGSTCGSNGPGMVQSIWIESRKVERRACQAIAP